MKTLAALTATDVAKRIRVGELSPVAAVEACLARIAETEPALRAWVHVDADVALKAARALEAEARARRLRGPLHGVPSESKTSTTLRGW